MDNAVSIDRPSITVSARWGCPDAFIVDRCLTRVETLFAKLCVIDYSPCLATCAIWFYVDGRLYEYGKRGVCDVRYSMRTGRLSCNIGISRNKWEAKSSDEIRLMLVSYLGEACDRFAKRMSKPPILFDEEAFRCDTGRVLEIFAADKGEYCPTPSEPMMKDVISFLEDAPRMRAAFGEEVDD